MVGIEAASHEPQNQPASFKNPKTRQRNFSVKEKVPFGWFWNI